MNSTNPAHKLADSSDGFPPADGEAPPDWAPQQQIARMLELCEAQMESALRESDLAVDALIRAFTNVAETVRAMSAPPQADTETSLTAQLEVIGRQAAAAVVAFQFYDKLSQRLGHVRHSLSRLAEFVCDDTQASRHDRWQALFTSLREQYRTEDERQIFRMIVEGASAEQARERIHPSTPTLRPGDDIELF